jgi:hypothetical protein
MPNAIASGTGAGSSAEFTLADTQRKTVTITAATGNVAPPSGCFYILEKKYGSNFIPYFNFDATETPFNVQGNGIWRISRDTLRHPTATALDLD